ncbi:hypothetical protein WKH56_20105 [Priestia sp. SB1]|uniref:hypothetical protein n=1 Tax=Priestia sp. SB1 TaxID=3132359 RepID=UPI00317F76FA
MIRTTVQVIRAFHKHKDEFPTLFSDFEAAKKKLEKFRKETGYKHPLKNDLISVSDEGEREYLSLVKKYLKVTKYPSNNRKVVVTTHSGGKHVGFYEDGSWWYSTLHNPKVAEKGIVIKWEKNYF